MSEQSPETLPAVSHAERIELWKMEQEDRRIAIAERTAEAARVANRTPAEEAFEVEQRMAKTLAASPFLPANVGKDMVERQAAAWGVLRYASMLGVDPYVLAQQIYVVQGRVGFSSAFLVALVNARAGLKRAIEWTIDGTTPPNLTVTCSAVDAAGIERVVVLTWAEVERWKWATKGDPWRADPALMMRYRSAAKLIRLYFGGSIAGLTMTAEELRELPADAHEVRSAPVLVAPAAVAEPRRITSTASAVIDGLLGEEMSEADKQAALAAERAQS